MLSSIARNKNHKLEVQTSDIGQEDEVVEQPGRNGVVDARPSDNMDEFEGNLNDNEDEVSKLYALQPIKERLQDKPLSSLPEKCVVLLGEKLDIERPVGLAGNYLDLASRLFPDKTNESLKFNLRKRKYPTSHLIQKYCKTKGQQATVFKLVEALYEMRRLDAIQTILQSFESQDQQDKKGKKSSARVSNLLTILRKRLVKDADTVSGLSVQTASYDTLSSASFDTLSSYPSEETICSHSEDVAYPPPVKPNYQAREKSFKGAKRNSSQKNLTNVIFIVTASDEVLFGVKTVQWLRKKGFDARCIETGKLEYASNPYQYVNELIQQALRIIIVCSPRYKEVVSNSDIIKELDNHDLAIRTVHFAMCSEYFNSGGYSGRYIPLLRATTSRTCVINPLSWTMAIIFEADDKEKRKDFLRQLSGEEKYTLGPIGPKPKIKPRQITGNFSDLRK